MQPLTIEWVEKAEGDYATVQRECRSRKLPNYDAACFHAQQCIEKYLKARLQEANLPIPYTHDLVQLIHQLAGIEPTWASFVSDARALSVFAVAFRYPGNAADRIIARDALTRCTRIRQQIREALDFS